MNGIRSIESALSEIATIVGGWENVVRCVVCGATAPRTLEVHDSSEDEGDQRLEIDFNADLTEWCFYGGDVKVRGLHCPECHKRAER